MKPISISKKILPALLCLLLSSGINAQVQEGMTSSEKNYTSFYQPRTDKDGEVLARNKDFANHPELGMAFFESPKDNCFEDISKRTETTKTYIKKNTRGTGLFIQSSTAPMHYKNGDDWVTVQSNLQPVGSGIFAAQRQPDPVSINTNEKGTVKIGGEGRSLSFNRELELIFIPVNGTEQIVGNADWTNYTAGDDGVYVKNAWPGIDIEISVFRGAAKTNFIVNHALPQYANGKLLVRDHLQMEDGMSLVASTEKGFVGNIGVFKGNEKVFDIYKAVAYEKNKIEESLIPLAYNINKTSLDIEVPGDFFNRPASAYPVVIDPFVQATNSVPVVGSTYSPTLTTGCSTLNSVPIPSGMTINGMTWSFSFQAVGTAWMNNCRNDFVMGTCKSPPLPGWYWGCAVNSPGTCNGTNLNIYPEMQACIPAAQCAYNQNVYLRWYRTINAGVCDNVGFTATTPFTITFSGNTLDPGAVTANLGTVTPVCGGTSVTLNANANYGALPYNFVWNPGGLPGQSVTVTPNATTTYTVTITDACGNLTSGTVTVNVTPTPAAPTVTSPVNLCENAPAPNMATYVTGTNIQWYNTQTGGAPIPMPVINTAIIASYTYWVSQTVNGCESQRTQIIVNVTAAPPAPTVVFPVNLCQNSSPPPITTFVTSGVNLLWYTTPIGGSPLAGTPSISTVSVTTITYYVSQTVNGCESPRSSLLIVVTAQPLMPNAPTPITYCQFSTATALTATGINITWYDVPTGGVALPSAPVPNTAVVGTVTYYATQTINGCESQRKAVVVNVIAKPLPPVVVTPVTYCQGQAAQPLSASVTGTAIKWYTTQTGGAPIPMPVVNTAVISNNTYWVSQTVNGCESDRASINVIVATQPGAPTVVSPVVMCQFSTPTPLTPNVTGTNLKWYPTQTGGVGTVTEPVINTAVVGSNTYWVSQSVGSCEGPRASIVVTINAKPAAPTVTTPVAYCQFSTATALTATGTNKLWYSGPTGGVGNAAAPVPFTTTVGTQDYYVSQTVNGCESDRAHIVVNINPTPADPVTVSPITYCQYETATPITNNVTGTNLKWYLTATGGSGTSTAPVINTNIVSDTIYYVSQSVGGCESGRSQIHVIIGTSPLPPTVVTPLVYCENDVIPPLTNSVTGFNLLWYTTATGGVGDPNAPVVDPTIPGTFFYYITQGLGNCESLRDTLEVIVNPTPALPTVVSPTEVCQFSTHQLSAQGQNLLWYTAATGGVGAATMNANTSTPTNITYYVSQTINGCEGPRQALVIKVNPQPVPPTAQTSYTYCQFETGATVLTATGTDLKWYDAGNNLLPGAPTPVTQVAGTFHYFVTQTELGCESNKLDISVLINPKPGLPIIEQITVCEGDAIPVLNVQGQNLLWYIAATGGTGNPVPPVPNTTTVGVQEYYVSQTINNCEGDRAMITVTVNPKVEASLTVSPDKGCTGQAVTVTFTGNGPLTSTYSWNFDGADDVTGTGAGPYQATWNTEGDKTVTVTITNLNCSATASANVNIQSTPTAHFDIQKDVCLKEVVRVQVDYDLMKYPEFVWTFGSAEVLSGSGYGPYSIKWNSTGQHYVSLQLTGINCPSEVFFDTINVHSPIAKVMSMSSNEICTADSILFTAQPGLDYQYEWLPATYFGDNTNSLSIWGMVQKAGYIQLRVTDRWGCVSADSLMLEPKSCCDVFLPNVFTPNGDGKNDVFRMVTKGNQELSIFVVMDRWGKRVFETVNQYETWDGSYNGEPQDMGTYQYYIRYKCIDSKEIMELKGDLILLR